MTACTAVLHGVCVVSQVTLVLHGVCVSGFPGYTCEPHNNPADFFLDVINGDATGNAMNKIQSSDGNTHTHHEQDAELRW